MDGHRFREPPRARRIRARLRMLARAREVARFLRPRPYDYHRDRDTGELVNLVGWKDLKGRPRKGMATWADVNEWRDAWAHGCYDHLQSCSCWGCGNPRRHFGKRTLAEKKAAASAADQIAEVRLQSCPRGFAPW